jgi:hypothetical protein
MTKKSFYKLLAVLAWAAVLVPMAANSQTPAKKPGAAVKAAPLVEFPMGNGGPRYEPSDRPDPFMNPLIQRKNIGNDAEEEAPRGAPPPGIAGMSANEVVLLGISISPDGKTAAFRGTDKRVYFLREGDHLFDGYIRAISADSVQLIHETKLRNGKVLTQEITKRLRT